MQARVAAAKRMLLERVRALDPSVWQSLAAVVLLEGASAALVTLNTYWTNRLLGHPVDFWHQAVRPALVDNGLWTLFAPVVIWMARRLRRSNWTVWIAGHLLLMTALSFAQTVLAGALHVPWAPGLQTLTWRSVLLGVWRESYSNVWMYWTTAVIYYGISYHRRFHGMRLREAELKASLARAELENLRVQLQPHFLFNALNTIASLVRERPAEAEDMIGDLSELLRESLHTRGVDRVSLEQELATLDCYLNIQLVRFSDRLTVRQTVAPEALSAAVPHLLLQPLVENAIRHGIARRARSGLVRVEAATDGLELELRVTDNGPGASLPVREGVGLGNTRSRLEQLYGARHAFAVESGGRGFAVTIRIPYEPWTAEARAAGAAA